MEPQLFLRPDEPHKTSFVNLIQNASFHSLPLMEESSIFLPNFASQPRVSISNCNCNSNSDNSNPTNSNTSNINGNQKETVEREKEKRMVVDPLSDTDAILQCLLRASLEVVFSETVWTVKRIYWAYSRPLLCQKFHCSRISHWIFEYVAEKRFEDQISRSLSADLDRCRKWVVNNVKSRNTVRGIPVFRYIKLVQPKLKSEGGDGSTECLLTALPVLNGDAKCLLWDMKTLEGMAKKEKEEEKERQKLFQGAVVSSPSSLDISVVKVGGKKSHQKKRPVVERDQNVQMRVDRLVVPHANKKEAKKMKLEMEKFPKVSVWEAEDSYLVAIEVPGLQRSSLSHKASIVMLEVQGCCAFPEEIESKWTGTVEFRKEFERTIHFSKPINPSSSGLIDIHSEGVIFYKCTKQQLEVVELDSSIKLD